MCAQMHTVSVVLYSLIFRLVSRDVESWPTVFKRNFKRTLKLLVSITGAVMFFHDNATVSRRHGMRRGQRCNHKWLAVSFKERLLLQDVVKKIL